MDKSIEEKLYDSIIIEDLESISNLLSQGPNANKITSHGKTCLGEAAIKGNVSITKMLIEFSKDDCTEEKLFQNYYKKKYSKSQKRKLRSSGHQDETVVKCKNLNDRIPKVDKTNEYVSLQESHHRNNQGYFVVIHNDGSSIDESKIGNLKSPVSSSSLVSSPQAELEWDEEITNVAPTTSEDENWTAMYRYARQWGCGGRPLHECTLKAANRERWRCIIRLHNTEVTLRTIISFQLIKDTKIYELSEHVKALRRHGFIENRWYAAILECTGTALASATVVTNGLNQLDAFMRTALHYAAEQGHTEIVKLLIDAGCKVDIPAGDGLTSLHIAVMRNHKDIVVLLLEAGSHVNYKTHEKMTPLHFAASRGYVELVRILVTKGAYLEARDTSERTALYLAAGRGHEEVVKFLASVGANVNGEEIHGYTPLCEAVWHRYAKVVEILLATGARITHSHKLLHNAIIQRQEEIVKLLADIGGGINLHDDNGDTPLLLSARLSQPAVALSLLQRGANINSCNNITGASALHIAVESIDCPNTFEVLLCHLLEYGVHLNVTALTGDTALNRALLLQKDDAAVLLIRHGADVNACDLHSRGLDNLTIASRRRTTNLARLLIKAGHHIPIPDANSPVPKQDTTLNWLYYICREPLTLLDICRIRIRSYCGEMVMFHYINALHLPKTLKRFLMLENEG